MPLSKQHKAETRQKILQAAGRLFRKHGLNGVSIDEIMDTAGLTRGGFYAHFSSKNELFRTVLRNNHDLLNRLQSAVHDNPANPEASALKVLRDYLAPEHFDLIAPNCSMAALAPCAFQAGDESRAAFSFALNALHDVLSQAKDNGANGNVWPTIALSIGAMTLARVMPDETMRKELLHDSSAALAYFLEG